MTLVDIKKEGEGILIRLVRFYRPIFMETRLLFYRSGHFQMSLRNRWVLLSGDPKKECEISDSRSSERARSALEAAGTGWLDAGGCPVASAVSSLAFSVGALVLPVCRIQIGRPVV